MKYEIWFSPTSRKELIDCYDYIRSDQHAPLNATRWLEGIMETIASLADLPHAHGWARENDEFREELRQVVYKSHRIIFDVADKKVRIHRIVHAARENIASEMMSGLTPKK